MKNKRSDIATSESNSHKGVTDSGHVDFELKICEGKFRFVPVPDELQGAPYLQDFYINRHLINQVVAAISYDDEVKANGAMNMLSGMAPKDTVESLLAAQMVAAHNMIMEFSRRAMLPEQPSNAIDVNVNRAAKLMRTYTAQVEALNKLKNKGRQTIKVQHVHVNEGGQAVVGNVQGGGGNG